MHSSALEALLGLQNTREWALGFPKDRFFKRLPYESVSHPCLFRKWKIRYLGSEWRIWIPWTLWKFMLSAEINLDRCQCNAVFFLTRDIENPTILSAIESISSLSTLVIRKPGCETTLLCLKGTVWSSGRQSSKHENISLLLWSFGVKLPENPL